MYVKRIQNRITFKIKIGYYLELLTPELIKLWRSIERGENVLQLEINELVSDHYILSVINISMIESY